MSEEKEPTWKFILSLIILGFVIGLVFGIIISPDSYANQNLAYENGVRCAVKYNLNEQQEEIGFYYKEYSVSETCIKLMEKHSIGGIQ